MDKLDIDKFTPVPNDLAKLSNVVKNDVVKKSLYDKLVAKADKIDTKKFVLKADHDKETLEAEKKIFFFEENREV